MGLADHLKPCTQMYLQKIVSCINLQLAIRISKKSDMHYPISDIQVEFENNRPIRYQITEKINCFYRRQTDVRTDIAFVNNR